MAQTTETLLQVSGSSGKTLAADVPFLQSLLAAMVIATLLIGGVLCIGLLLELTGENLLQLASR